MGEATNREDYVLMFLALPGKEYEPDQIRVMKGMFLLTREGPASVRELYSFEPYDWGPFDTDVYRDLDLLEGRGLLVSEGLGGNRRAYRLTSQGLSRARTLLQGQDPDVVKSLAQVKEFTTSQAFVPLLRTIYKKYPGQAQKTRLR